uniref:Sugar phosphate transporter domain-containing protein n=1 Tax=Sexangularia sp. CB-2014 TaxID=1486929 RepID=A0A7S1YJC6_9EUKA
MILWTSATRRYTLLTLTTLSLSLQALLFSSIATSTHFSSPHESIMCTLLFELTKLGLSLLPLAWKSRSTGQVAAGDTGTSDGKKKRWSFEESRLYALPALVYLINDNLHFLIYNLVRDAALVEVLFSLRILTTTLWFRFMLSRRLSRTQWAALFLLTVGTANAALGAVGQSGWTRLSSSAHRFGTPISFAPQYDEDGSLISTMAVVAPSDRDAIDEAVDSLLQGADVADQPHFSPDQLLAALRDVETSMTAPLEETHHSTNVVSDLLDTLSKKKKKKKSGSSAAVGAPDGDEGVSPLGIFLVAVYCILSGFGAVFVEFLFKRNASESFYQQNAQLYGYGCIFNMLVLVAFYWREVTTTAPFEMFFGASGINALLLVANNALCGLLIAALVKYANTIEKVYAHSVSMVITLATSSLLLSRPPSPSLVISALIITTSIFIYHSEEGGRGSTF